VSRIEDRPGATDLASRCVFGPQSLVHKARWGGASAGSPLTKTAKSRRFRRAPKYEGQRGPLAARRSSLRYPPGSICRAATPLQYRIAPGEQNRSHRSDANCVAPVGPPALLAHAHRQTVPPQCSIEERRIKSEKRPFGAPACPLDDPMLSQDWLIVAGFAGQTTTTIPWADVLLAAPAAFARRGSKVPGRHPDCPVAARPRRPPRPPAPIEAPPDLR